jgi:hypothetical protein
LEQENRLGDFGDLSYDPLNGLADLQQKFPTIFYDGSIPNEYLQGKIALHLHIGYRLGEVNRHDVCATFRVWRGREVDRRTSRDLGIEVELLGEHVAIDGMQQPVLVSVVEPMKEGQVVLGRIRSVERLTLLDLCPDCVTDTLKSVSGQGVVPRSLGRADRIGQPAFGGFEGGIIERFTSDLDDQVIQGSSQIAGTITNQESEVGRVGMMVDIKAANVTPPFVLFLMAKSVRVSLEKSPGLFVKSLQVLVCPIHLGMDAGQIKGHTG